MAPAKRILNAENKEIFSYNILNFANIRFLALALITLSIFNQPP